MIFYFKGRHSENDFTLIKINLLDLTTTIYDICNIS